jgi:polyhydroxyalkanoate synthase
VRFWARQWLQAFSISNIPATNADIAQATLDQRGLNLVKGFCAFYRDVSRQLTTTSKAPAALLGTRLASTPGKVVLRTELAEIIQYTPSTRHVRPEPVVIVPAWIMKYYILDLSHDRSLVRYLVDQGFTVFIISWKNPDTDERDLTLDDYRRQGIDAAIRAALAITGSRKCHLAGYCLGGTAAVIEAATLARDGKDNLASLSLLAAQIDFTDAGPLKLFINSDQLSLLDDAMWWNGALTADQMAGAFRLLRAHEMLWSHAIESYFLDEDANPADLQIWNADATRMPYRMHSEYLHRLFHDNDLAEGRYVVEGRAVSCADIHVPVFAVGTETDFVAPWQSVYKIDHLVSGPVTFVLANGGHNAGIVAPPGDERRNYRLRGRGCDGLHLNAANWFETADHHAGSWWTAWAAWLHENSGDFVQTPTLGGAADAILPLADAPGTYVFG